MTPKQFRQDIKTQCGFTSILESEEQKRRGEAATLTTESPSPSNETATFNVNHDVASELFDRFYNAGVKMFDRCKCSIAYSIRPSCIMVNVFDDGNPSDVKRRCIQLCQRWQKRSVAGQRKPRLHG